MSPASRRNQILRENLAVLRTRHASACEAVYSVSASGRVRCEPARSGAPTVLAWNPSRSTFSAIHSRYDPLLEAQRAVDSIPRAGTYVIFGFGAGYVPRLLCERDLDATVLVCEASDAGFRTLLESVDLTDVLNCRNIYPVVGPQQLQTALSSLHYPMIAPGLQSWSLNAWVDLPAHREPFSVCRRELALFRERLSLDQATMERMGKVWSFSAIRNIAAMDRHPGMFVDDPAGKLHAIIAGRRVGIAAAGPSLDREMENLRSCDVVIATDTAAPALRSGGIHAKIVLSLDSQIWSYLHFRLPRNPDQILVADIGVSPTTVGRSAVTIVGFGNHPLARLAADAGLPGVAIDTDARNVTGSAYALAARFGAGEIITAGADFAYTEGRAYAAGTYLYDVARRRAHRFAPEESFWTRFIIGRSTETEPRGTSFRYTSPLLRVYAEDLAVRKARFANRSREAISTVSKPAGLRAGDTLAGNNRSVVSATVFLREHRDALKRLLEERRNEFEVRPVPARETAEAMGPHGRAHLPFIAWYAARGANTPITTAWREILTFIDRIFSRYY